MTYLCLKLVTYGLSVMLKSQKLSSKNSVTLILFICLDVLLQKNNMMETFKGHWDGPCGCFLFS